MKGVRRGLKSRQQRDQLATLDRGSGENVGSTCREGTPAGPFARPDVRPGGESALGTAGSTFSPLSLLRQGQVQTEPVNTSVESFLTFRALGFPREFGFGVRRRGVVVSVLGTVRISVGTHLSGGH